MGMTTKIALTMTAFVAIFAALAPTAMAEKMTAQTIGSQRTITLDFTDTNVTDDEISYLNQTYTPDTAPDSLWYGFKRFGEGIRMFFTFDAGEKAKLRLKFAHERLAEAKYMADQGDQNRVKELIREYENEINETGKDIDRDKGIGRNVSAITREVQDDILKNTLVLRMVYENVPDNAKAAIERAINNSIEKMTETEGLEHNWTEEQLSEKIQEEMQKHDQRWLSMEQKFQEKLQRKLSDVNERIQEAIEKNQTEKVENLQKVREQINSSIDRKITQIEDKRREFDDKFNKKLNRTERENNETEVDDNEENQTINETQNDITGTVLISTDKTNYTENDSVTIIVLNNLSDQLYYGGCGSMRHKQITLETKTNETWSETNGTQDWFVCLLAVEQEPNTLEINQTKTYTVDNQTLFAGKYSAVFDYKTSIGGNWSEAISNEFIVA